MLTYSPAKCACRICYTSSLFDVISMLYERHLGNWRIDQFLAHVKFYSAAVGSVCSVHVTHGNVLLQRRRRTATRYAADLRRTALVHDSCTAWQTETQNDGNYSAVKIIIITTVKCGRKRRNTPGLTFPAEKLVKQENMSPRLPTSYAAVRAVAERLRRCRQ